MEAVRTLGLSRLIGRSLLVGIGYAVTSLLVGVLLTLVGAVRPGTGKGIEALPVLLAQGSLLGIVLGTLALEIKTSYWQRMTVLGSALFFNSLSLSIEGMFFAPTLMYSTLPWTIVQNVVLTSIVGIVVLRLFPATCESSASRALPLHRSWFSWSWRFAISAFSYLAFYFVFGAINYALVTKPYYEAHAGGLVVPGVATLLAAESVRAPLIALSVLPLLLTIRRQPPQRAIAAGLVLFCIGGVVPLLNEINTLPLYLLIASGWEIFFQNMSTGLVAGWLLGSDQPNAFSERAQPLHAPL